MLDFTGKGAGFAGCRLAGSKLLPQVAGKVAEFAGKGAGVCGQGG